MADIAAFTSVKPKAEQWDAMQASSLGAKILCGLPWPNLGSIKFRCLRNGCYLKMDYLIQIQNARC